MTSSTQRKRVGVAIGVLALVIGATACGGSDTMPDVKGKKEAEAKKLLEDESLTVTVTQDHRPGVEAGIVLDQTPKAGDPFPDDAKVTIVVEDASRATNGTGSGTGTGNTSGAVTVPNVIGKTVADADAVLTAAGLRRSNITKVLSDKPADTVIDTHPKDGSDVPSGSLVELTVADGSLVAVPSLIGKTLEEALQAIAAAHLRVGEIKPVVEGPGQPGRVVAQSVDASINVVRDTPLNISVKQDSVTIPRVEGQLLSNASASLLGSGLLFSMRYQMDPSRPPGTIISLNPGGGTMVARGSSVAMTLARRRPVFPGRFDWDPRTAKIIETLSKRSLATERIRRDPQ